MKLTHRERGMIISLQTNKKGFAKQGLKLKARKGGKSQTRQLELE